MKIEIYDSTKKVLVNRKDRTLLFQLLDEQKEVFFLGREIKLIDLGSIGKDDLFKGVTLGESFTKNFSSDEFVSYQGLIDDPMVKALVMRAMRFSMIPSGIVVLATNREKLLAKSIGRLPRVVE